MSPEEQTFNLSEMLSEVLIRIRSFHSERERAVPEISSALGDAQKLIEGSGSELGNDTSRIENATRNTITAVKRSQERLSAETEFLLNSVAQFNSELQRCISRLVAHTKRIEESGDYIHQNLCEKYNELNEILQNNADRNATATNLFDSAGNHATEIRSQDRASFASSCRRRAIWYNNVGFLLGLNGRRIEAERYYALAQQQNKKAPTSECESRQIHIRQIFVRFEPGETEYENMRKQAEEIHRRWQDGAPFQQLARQVSSPDTEGAGYIRDILYDADAVPVEFRQAVFHLAPGQISNPIEVENGCHIFKVEEKREGRAWVRHIFVPLKPGEDAQKRAEERMKTIQNSLRNGEDFTSLATTHSDDTLSKDKGGDMGIVEIDKLPRVFRIALEVLAEGEVSEPVESSFGLHLLKLEKQYETIQKSAEELYIPRSLSEPWINLAVNAFLRNSYDEARRLLTKSDAPEDILLHPAAQNLLGLICAKKGDWTGALEHFEKAAKVWSYRLEVLKNLALTYRKLGRYYDWDRAMLQASRLNPLDPVVADWMQDKKIATSL